MDTDYHPSSHTCNTCSLQRRLLYVGYSAEASSREGEASTHRQQRDASPLTEGVQRPSDPEDVLAHLDDEEQKVIKAASASSGWLDRARLSAAAGPTVGDDGSRLEEDSFVHRHARLVDEGLKAQPSPKQLLQRGLLHPSRGFRLYTLTLTLTLTPTLTPTLTLTRWAVASRTARWVSKPLSAR